MTSSAELANLIEAMAVENSVSREKIEQLRNSIHSNNAEMKRLEELRREAARQEALAAQQRKLEPDWENPELQALLTLLKSNQHFSQLREFQQADLVQYFDKRLKGADGFINANDMGTGKTAETALALWAWEKANND